MSESVARERIVEAARQASAAGWSRPEAFNVAVYFNASIAELYRLLEWAGALEAVEQTKTRRRQARKIAWRLSNALRQLKEDRSVIAAARDFGVNGTQGSLSELEAAVANCAARRRAEMALGAIHLSTQKRSSMLISAMDRLENDLARIGLSPIANAPARVARPRNAAARDTRAVRSADRGPEQNGPRRDESDGWD